MELKGNHGHRARWVRTLMASLVCIGCGVTATTAAAAPSAHASSGQISVQMPFFGVQNAFFGVIEKGAQLAAKQLGVKLIWTIAGQNFSNTAAVQSMTTALAQKATVWGVVDDDPAAMDPVIKKAEAEGITVIDLNSGENDTPRPYLMYIGQDEYQGGELAGTSVWTASKGSLKQAVCMNQVVGDTTLELRCSGFAAALKPHGVKVDQISVAGGPTAAYAAALSYLTANPNTGAIYALDAQPDAFNPILQAMQKLGRANGKIQFVANDLSTFALQQVKAGNTLGLIDQQEFLQGYLTVVWAYLYEKYDLVPGGDGNVLTGPSLVTSANVAKVQQLVGQGDR
jgi:simple sugar transport system substrate-binding protein